MSEEVRDALRQELPTALKDILHPILQEKVNGKIDKMREDLMAHNARHEEHMMRMMPIIEAFEFSERRWEDAQSAGWVAMKLSAFITAVGGAVLIVRQLFLR